MTVQIRFQVRSAIDSGKPDTKSFLTLSAWHWFGDKIIERIVFTRIHESEAFKKYAVEMESIWYDSTRKNDDDDCFYYVQT